MSHFESWVLTYLVNSLWQAPLVAAAAWLAARLMRRAGPAMEHRVWVVALLLEAGLPACPMRLGELAGNLRHLLAWSGGAAGGNVRVTIQTGAASSAGLLRLPAAVLTGIALAYGCSLAYLAVRLAWGVWRTAAMERRAERMSLAGEAARTWERCRGAFAVEHAELAETPVIAGPVTVGLRRGVLLVPPGFLARLAEGDLEAVMAHECAHMRRRDFAKNLAYAVLALPVAYHPALWLTRARMAESREMVCDALAAEVSAGMGRERYARSLLRLATMLVATRPDRTLHAIGIFDANIFERRVMNLTQKRVEIKGTRRMALAGACVVVGLATCASALALRMEVGAPSTGAVAQGAGGPARVSGGVMAGNILTRVPPVYPQEAKDARISGAVVLHAIIGKDGVVENLQVVSGPEALRGSALDSVRQWTYKPYLLNGEPVEVDTTITVTYSFSN